MTEALHPEDFEAGPDGRPDFIIKLGLMLPCTVEDVKQAYLAKVRSVHPDLGGSQSDFLELQAAFERATQYANFLAGRRKWLSAQIERYVEQEAALERIRSAGGTVREEHQDWLVREIGEDFAQVLDTVVEVRWNGPRVTDVELAWLVANRPIFAGLRVLDLSGAAVTDAAVQELFVFAALERLSLRGAPVTHRALELLQSLPNLTQIDLRETRVGGFRLYFVRRNYPDLEILH